jgi:hypothetical protein
MQKITIIFFVTLFTLAGCSIEKRLYRPGFSVQWISVKKSKGNKDQQKEEIVSNVKEGSEQIDPSEDLTASAETENENFQNFQLPEDNIELIPSYEVLADHEISSRLENEDTIVHQDVHDEALDEYPEKPGKKKRYGWVYIVALVVFYAILGGVLWLGALYPFHVGVALIFPLSPIFGMDDRAGFLFGILSGLSYVGLYFLTGTIGFWGIFFLGFAALLLSLLIATYVDDLLDRGERKDDYPPPPPPQAAPGDDW